MVRQFSLFQNCHLLLREDASGISALRSAAMTIMFQFSESGDVPLGTQSIYTVLSHMHDEKD